MKLHPVWREKKDVEGRSREPVTTYGHATTYGQGPVALVTFIGRIPADATIVLNGAVRALTFLYINGSVGKG